MERQQAAKAGEQAKRTEVIKRPAPNEAVKVLCAKYSLDSLTAKAKTITQTISFRGFYLGMPMDETAALMNHRMGCPSETNWYELHGTNIVPVTAEKATVDEEARIRTGKPCAAGTSDGTLLELELDTDQVKALFGLKEIAPSDFVERFASEYKTPAPKYTPKGVDSTGFGGAGAVANSEQWTITDGKTYELVFTSREGVTHVMGITESFKRFKLTLRKPQGTFKD